MKQKYLKSILLFTAFIITSLEGLSQDIQFSQFYAVPLYQNPAFTGSAHRTRATLHQRLQWPKLEAKFTTSLLSVDHYFNNYKSGVGLMLIYDSQSYTTIGSLEATLSYAYEVQINSDITFRPGLSASFVNKDFRYNNLRFPSQFKDTTGFIEGSISSIPNLSNNKMYPDIGAGGIIYTKKFWFGFAGHHLNVPNQSVVPDQVSRLPIKGSFTGGYKFVFEEEKSAAYLETGKDISLTPTFHYKFQGKSDQFDIGLYGIYDMLMIGFWYRGLPGIKQYKDRVQNNESVIFLVGYKVKSISIGYSYDLTLSKLVPAHAGGAHEINLTYLYNKPHKKHKPMKRLPCPQFNKH